VDVILFVLELILLILELFAFGEPFEDDGVRVLPTWAVGCMHLSEESAPAELRSLWEGERRDEAAAR
jgi:hypothetical protein